MFRIEIGPDGVTNTGRPVVGNAAMPGVTMVSALLVVVVELVDDNSSPCIIFVLIMSGVM